VQVLLGRARPEINGELVLLFAKVKVKRLIVLQDTGLGSAQL
jgi:hypothetical protein